MKSVKSLKKLAENKEDPRDNQTAKLLDIGPKKTLHMQQSVLPPCTLINAAHASSSIIFVGLRLQSRIRVMLCFIFYVCSSATQLLIWRNAAIRRMPPRWISIVHRHQTKNNQQGPTWIDSIPSSPLASPLAPKFEDYCILSNQQINKSTNQQINKSTGGEGKKRITAVHQATMIWRSSGSTSRSLGCDVFGELQGL